MAIHFAGTGAAGRILRPLHPRLGGLYYPFFVGCWFQADNLVSSSAAVWSLSSESVTTDYFMLSVLSSGSVRMTAGDSVGTSTNSTVGGTLAAMAWAFAFSEFISPTYWRVTVLLENGSTVQRMVISGGPTQPTALDTFGISTRRSSNAFTGSVAELYYGVGSLFTSAQSALLFPFVRRIAHRGPFAEPYLAPNLLEYRSFHRGSRFFDPNTDYATDKSPWVADSAPSAGHGIAAGPRLSSLYERPGKMRRVFGM